jgi:putative oxidoreductase
MIVEKVIILFIGAFFSILFIQSGLDKVFNWKSELAFNKEHFSKTFLKPTVPLMFTMLTMLELSSGLISLVGLIIYLLNRGHDGLISFIANCMCTVTLLCLFLGQRIAKDYAGAQSLVSYFIVALLGVLLFIS